MGPELPGVMPATQDISSVVPMSTGVYPSVGAVSSAEVRGSLSSGVTVIRPMELDLKCLKMTDWNKTNGIGPIDPSRRHLDG